MTDAKTTQSKVERVIERRDLEGLGKQLEDYWTQDSDAYSLRELSDYFNKQVLRSAIESASMRAVESNTENYYNILVGSDTNPSERHQVRRTLERNGVDPDEVQKDFVSHQTVHTYLRNHRDVSRDREKSPEERRQAVKQRIDRLRGRTEAVVKESLNELARHDQLPIDEFDTIVDFRVMDTTTGETRDLEEVLGDEG
jgi:hypothetical protein